MPCGDSPSALPQDLLTSSVTTTTSTYSTNAEHVAELTTTTTTTTTTTDMSCMPDVSDSHADFPTDTPGSAPLARDREQDQIISSVVSSQQEKVEISFEQVEQKVDSTMLEDKALTKSSSFEDIYSDTTFELPYGQVKDDVDKSEIGDRFESRHVVSKKGEKTSSFENLYSESQKESKCVEEKDVDERETELQAEDFTRPEKGPWKDEQEAETSHKNGHLAHFEAEEVESTAVVEEEHGHPTALPLPSASAQEVRETDMSRSSSVKSSTPIDVTLESGLDLIGQDQPQKQVDVVWERSKSYDSEPSDGDDKLRKRHHSTPEHVAESMPVDEHPTDAWVDDDRVSTSSSEMARLDDIQPPQDMSEEYGLEEGASAMQPGSRPGLGPRYESIEDDEMREIDIEEHQEELAHGIPEHLDEPDQELVTGAEGQLETDDDPEMQSSRLVLKKQVHKKTIIRDGKEETIVTEDTHIEQENEGPEELKDSMQKVIDQFMDGSDQLGEQ